MTRPTSEEAAVHDDEGASPGGGTGEADAGTAAVLYGLLTTFSDALGGLDGRLAAIEAAVRAGPHAPASSSSGAADPAVADALRRVEESMQQVLVAVEGRQAGIDLLLDTVRSLATRVEAMGVRVERAREGIEEVVSSTAGLRQAAGALQSLEAAAERVSAGEDEAVAVAALAQEVRSQSRLLEERTTGLAASVADLRSLLEAHVRDTAQSLGRRASDAGRRLAGDLGLRSRPRQPPAGSGR